MKSNAKGSDEHNGSLKITTWRTARQLRIITCKAEWVECYDTDDRYLGVASVADVAMMLDW